VRAQRIEVVQRGPGRLCSAGGDLAITQRFRGCGQIPVPVVGTIDAHCRENRCKSVDFAEEVLGGEAALAELFRKCVRRGRHRYPAFHKL
jgi:hypothetical protein